MTLIVSCSVVAFLTNVIRLRIVVFILYVAIMTAWAFAVSEAPYSFLAIVSPSSNDSLFISDISPQFASLTTIGIRLASLLFAAMLLMFATLLVRIDGMSFKLKSTLGSGLFILSVVLCSSITGGVVQYYYADPAKWREFHESNALVVGNIDILDISGSVSINPKASLFVDLELLLKAETSETFMFTFNPAMKIDDLFVDDIPVNYVFKHGLLRVEKGELSSSNETYRMRILASGVPNPRFGYFNSAIDYLTAPAVPRRAVALLGKDGSIYEKNFVALMSGVHWYPTSGPLSGTSQSAQQGKDFFTVDLSIDLAAKNWHLVGPGTKLKTASSTSSEYQVNPEFAVSGISLFASEFEHATISVGELTFGLYLHKKHSQNMRFWNEDLLDALSREIERLYRRFTDRGLSLPIRTLNIVETLDRLRTVGGGLRMKSLTSLPEIGILKESGFPTANFEFKFSQQIPREISEVKDFWIHIHITLLNWYFNLALGTDSPFSGISERFWSHHISASGEFADILDEIILALISTLDIPFSIYSTLNVADLTQLMVPRSSSFQRIGIVEIAREQEKYFGSRLNLWNHMEQTGLKERVHSEEYQERLELVLLKARAIAQGLLSLNDDEKIITWVMSVRNRFEGNTYTLTELIECAELHGVQVEPFLTSWLTESGVPGYVVSPLTVAQVANDTFGNQQFQATLFVRNVQQVDGVIRLTYPGEFSANHLSWSDEVQTPGIQIAAKSAKRINITTPYELRQIQIDPGLSLERTPFRIHANSPVSNQRQTTAPRPFLENSNWTPRTKQQIVVDDLDDGFSVSQPEATSNLFISLTPLTWFSPNELRVFEKDKGLSVNSDPYLLMPRDVWFRRLDAGAYGRHRKTTAIARIPKMKPISKVRFLAHLPTSASWKLEYHLPVEWAVADHTKLSYILTVDNAGKDWNLTFNTRSEDVIAGWNTVDQLELKAGIVTVDVTATQTSELINVMFADAIRWTKVSEE
ncbi:MAG: hypothetical protein F4077_02670 [Gammaproteobacteria bacterium]|nr:hypothetical protein [Gammaproteobacteria bacterium]